LPRSGPRPDGRRRPRLRPANPNRLVDDEHALSPEARWRRERMESADHVGRRTPRQLSEAGPRRRWDRLRDLQPQPAAARRRRGATAEEGTAYVIYTLGASTVHVGAVALPPGQPRASAEVTVTAGEEGAQGIPALAVDRNNAVWIVYMHEPTGGQANEVRVLR